MPSVSIYKGSSPYGSYEIVDEEYNGRPARVLYGDEATPQSGIALDDEPELLFNYMQRFLELLMSRPPKQLLVIGGGGFVLPTAAFHHFPDTHIDVAELDELLVTIARDYFDLPQNKRLITHVGDGADFVSNSTKTYNAILIDAFSGSTIPPHLLTYKTLLEYKKHLTKDGFIALNIISTYQSKKPHLAHEVIATFQEVFPSVEIYQADPDETPGVLQNYIIIASQQDLSFDYLQSVAYT